MRIRTLLAASPSCSRSWRSPTRAEAQARPLPRAASDRGQVRRRLLLHRDAAPARLRARSPALYQQVGDEYVFTGDPTPFGYDGEKHTVLRPSSRWSPTIGRAGLLLHRRAALPRVRRAARRPTTRCKDGVAFYVAPYPPGYVQARRSVQRGQRGVPAVRRRSARRWRWRRRRSGTARSTSRRPAVEVRGPSASVVVNAPGVSSRRRRRRASSIDGAARRACSCAPPPGRSVVVGAPRRGRRRGRRPLEARGAPRRGTLAPRGAARRAPRRAPRQRQAQGLGQTRCARDAPHVRVRAHARAGAHARAHRRRRLRAQVVGGSGGAERRAPRADERRAHRAPASSSTTSSRPIPRASRRAACARRARSTASTRVVCEYGTPDAAGARQEGGRGLDRRGDDRRRARQRPHAARGRRPHARRPQRQDDPQNHAGLSRNTR